LAGLAERIYFDSPIWAQQSMVAAYGWWWYRRRFGSQFHDLVQEFREHDRWTTEQFRSYQKVQLGKVLAVASRSRYYRQVFGEAGVKPDMDPFEALRRLPLLSKETLRLQARDLLTESHPQRGTKIFKSSGTTGTPTEIYYTPEFHALEMAVPEARNLGWAGLSYRDRRVMFGVRKVCRFEQQKPPFWRFSPAENMAYASIYHLSPLFLPQYVEFLRNYHPSCVMGYPSALHTIARYAVENNDYPAPAKAVVTTSETVSAQARQAIESAWKCRVYDRYGAVEGCLFASQCEYGSYHVSPEVGIIEIVDREGNPLPPGLTGEVVCTGLRNTTQPLIRYRIGDVACWAIDQHCRCGREMPILEGIEGRYEDVCFLPDGREMLRFDTVFKGVENIREAQVVQDKVDSFIIYVIPSLGFGQNDIRKIRSNMQIHVGSQEIRVEQVGVIPRSPSGKYRSVVCNLSEEEKVQIRNRRASSTC
jgi:phenylacetate-CoA ligase